MIQQLIQFSIRHKLLVLLATLALIIWGGISVSRLPLDAIPDITNNQVVVVTQSPNLSAVEMEQFVTYPVEMALRNIQNLQGIRSVSQFGLSIVTLDFADNVDLYFARSQVNERLINLRDEIPAGFGVPTMNPVSTGLGEIFQYVIKPTNPADTSWSPLELRNVQDWVVKKQLLGTPGVAEISSFGGYLQQYHVVVEPQLLRSTGATLSEVFEAVANGNQNTGAAYLEKDGYNYFIRGLGLAGTVQDLEQIVVRVNGATPVLVRDVAKVEISSAVRYGALTQGDREAVGGIVLMLKGENSRNVILNVKERLRTLEASLPKGLTVEAYLDRELLIDRTISTVGRNLLEGGLIVIFVLVLLLGHFRAGLIVASVIPLSMLFAVGCMVAFKVSGNLMSLGAIDFGLIVDGAVIIVENIVRMLHLPSKRSREEVVGEAAGSMASASFFGQIIILIVYVPLLTLSGIEGKMFQPMALTVIFALAGAVLLSLTYVPAVSSLFLKKNAEHHETFADRLMNAVTRKYWPLLEGALRWKKWVVGSAVVLLVLAAVLFQRMGGEFIPQLDEGDYAIEVRMLPGSSLTSMVRTAEHLSADIQRAFPDEVKFCTGKIGTAEVPMDPMSIEEMDLMLTMQPREQWKKVHNRTDFEAELQKVLDQAPGVFTSIQQPIAMRFNELMSGAKTDVIVQVLGPDLERLAKIGNDVVRVVNKIPGAADVSLAKAEGLPQLFVTWRREALARYGLSVSTVNNVLQTAIAGQKAGLMFEDNRRFDVVVKLRSNPADPLKDLENVQVATPTGATVPLSELADIGIREGPMAVNRVGGERCVNVALNVRGRDIQSVVSDVQQQVAAHVPLPEGYHVTYGGQFENLQSAQARLRVVVPAALLLILLLLYFSFGTVRESLLIFSAIPFAAVGGVLALWLRGMPFSISAGVGFIALFGVAVLNGMVLIGQFQQLERAGVSNLQQRICEGVMTRFRPVLMTASVASLGFLPMAIAQGAGAEVQKPLATVVIGGLISATFLTLVILPVLYAIFSAKKTRRGGAQVAAVVLFLLALKAPSGLMAQRQWSENEVVNAAFQRHPALQRAQHAVEEKAALSNANMPLPPLQAYTWLPFNPEVGVTQNFDNPALVRADRRVRKQETTVAQTQMSLTALAVQRQVTLAYDRCVYLRDKAALLLQHDSLLAEYLRVADLEYRTGNISALAQLNTQTRSREAHRLALSTALEYRSALSLLQLQAGLPDSAWQPANALAPRALVAGDTGLLADWCAQRRQLADLDLLRQQKKTLPGFALGVVTNVDPYNRFLPNAYLGVNVPLFRKGYRAEEEAATARQKMALDDCNLQQQEARQRREQALRQWQAARSELDYWAQWGEPQAALLLNTAEVSRRAGEIGSTEYLLAVQQAFALQLSRVESLHLHNQAAIEAAFWMVP